MSTVVMDCSDYSVKIYTLLHDLDTYQPMARNQTGALKMKMNSVLWSLRQRNHLSDET